MAEKVGKLLPARVKNYLLAGLAGKIKKPWQIPEHLRAADGLEGADSERARYQIRAWK